MWNNALSFSDRKNANSSCRLFVPKIKDIWEIHARNLEENLRLGSEIVFEEFHDWELFSKSWLENYIEWTLDWVWLAIFDNHNLAFYFIWKYFLETWKKLDLIHIDQHSDMRVPEHIPKSKLNLKDIQKYTFEWLNVWNYLIALKELWYIWNIYQKRTEISVINMSKDSIKNCILNIDMDFWDKKMCTSMSSLHNLRKIIRHASFVCIASSPYFIDQKTALDLIKKLLT